ncbi:NADPH-dependent FMN reductase [Tsukamurella pulmonis]|uniref:NADPH-dependent FMN reductase n=1 Tax=Tsukamurella pulmonis TaxID=47312 RepID=UPI000794BA82|nr:NAD(P)H-dependent oxidoreductase [Tsukamurella pulmonis]KXP13192.1 NADPH-dependent FMN reductase [Tsukamurella pulmonis]RDH10159.1 NADPH-dependent oxidoreductase [Tsukamurella pulmonis]
MKIGIILGSIRDGRKAEEVGKWVAAQAEAREGVEITVIDLKAFDVPLLTSATVPGAANRNYDSAAVTAWGKAIDAEDGFIFVTPEYNHSVPGGFKNAFDSIGPEWTGKTVAFVAYGADNGVRSVEHWRQITANFSMVDVRAQVSLGLFTDFDGDGAFTPLERREHELATVLDQLIAATTREQA